MIHRHIRRMGVDWIAEYSVTAAVPGTCFHPPYPREVNLHSLRHGLLCVPARSLTDEELGSVVEEIEGAIEMSEGEP